MAYDEDLADRIRDLLSRQRWVTEKKMFGGLAFLIGGNMAIAASGQGGDLRTKRRLEKRVELGAAYASALPPKKK